MGLPTKMFFVIFRTLSFCLILHECKSLDEFSVYTTELCPRNQTEWNDRSSAINCNKSNGYMCLPNENITGLLEFCYIYPFIWIEEGSCLILNKRFLNLYSYNCSSFRSGCPSSSVPSYELFKYPSCTSIENGCFIAEQSCERTTTTFIQETSELTSIDNGNGNIDTDLLVVVVIIDVICVISFLCIVCICYKRGCTLCARKQNDELFEINPILQGNRHEDVDLSEQDNRLEAMMKTEVTTSTELETLNLETLHEFVLFIIENPDPSWSQEGLIKIMEDEINRMVDNRREDLLKQFLNAVKDNRTIKKTLSTCGIKIYDVLDSIKKKCKAAQLKVTKGCFCFTFSFATDTDLEHYLNILRNQDEDFKRNISKVMLDKTLLEVFQVDSKCVSWNISEVKVIKETRFSKEEQVLEPANGFAINRTKSKGKKTKVNLLNVEKSIKNSKKSVVVAIEIGYSNSGICVSSKIDWRKMFTHKTPTCLLLKKDLSESLFGYEAEDKFSTMTREDRNLSYFFFQHFGMILYEDRTEKRDNLLYDSEGKSHEASLIFEHSIRNLKECAYRIIELLCVDIGYDDIQYIFTVPGIIGEKAKLLIREAALKSGIKLENMMIALKPEAASIYYQYMTFFEENASSPSNALKSGTKYMVVDLGGTSSEITLLQICEDNYFEAVLPTIKSQWGGTTVDDEFFKFLSELVEPIVWSIFKYALDKEFFKLTRSFETTKQRSKPDHWSGETELTLPPRLTRLSVIHHNVNSFKDVVEKNKHRDQLRFSEGKLVMDNTFFFKFFEKAVNEIVKLLDENIRKTEAKDIKSIVLVGGFSECLFLRDAIKKHFTNASIIIPNESGLAVQKGAVYLGHACF